MVEEIIYRITRITIIVVFLVVASSMRNDTIGNYNGAKQLIENGPNISVKVLESNDDWNNLNEKHKVQIKNISNKTENVSFVIENDNKDEYPFNYMNYEIQKDGEVVKTGIVQEDGRIYDGNLQKKESSIYDIKFWLEESQLHNLTNSVIKAKMIIN